MGRCNCEICQKYEYMSKEWIKESIIKANKNLIK